MPFTSYSVIETLNSLSKVECLVLFGEADRFKEWLQEQGVKHNVSKL
jgi:hypothetical protein